MTDEEQKQCKLISKRLVSMTSKVNTDDIHFLLELVNKQNERIKELEEAFRTFTPGFND